MKVLVIGATGKQGGHVARNLLKKGHTVYAFTRDATSPATKALQKLGAQAVTGDLSNRASIENAIANVDAIFAITIPFEEEVKQGMAIADIAKAKGKYLVYSSVASANKNTGITFFDSKGKIEQHIAKIGVEACIIAPVYFMDNLMMLKPLLQNDLVASPLTPERKLAQIALDDIAAFAVLVLENKKRFMGKRIEIASDELTGSKMTEILSQALNKPLKYFQTPMEEIRKLNEEIAKMYEWLERVGFNVDIAALKKNYPEIGWHTFEAWAKQQDWKEFL